VAAVLPPEKNVHGVHP